MTSASRSVPPGTPTAGARTAPVLWRYALAEHRSTPAFAAEGPGGWSEVSWLEAGRRVEALANGLLAHGVGRGEAVAILARTSLEWALLDWASMSVGAVIVGLYPTSSAEECGYILEHADAVLAFVEDDDQLAKIRRFHGELPKLRELIPLGELDRLEAEGREYADTNQGALAAAVAAVREDDLATLIYTSGTTGSPKGCMLTHRNLFAAATRVERGLTRADDVVLLFLPLAHSFGRLVHQSAAFHGYTIAFCADPSRTADALTAVRPTVLPAVPRVYEKIHAGVVAQIEQSGGAKRAIGRWGVRIGARAGSLRLRGEPVGLRLRLQERIADRLVFSQVRQRLGGRMRLGVSGAAPLATDVLQFFHALGLLVVEGYGLTETSSSTTANHPDAFRFGTVGQAVEGCEVRLAEDGEILVRSDTVFAGYHKDPEATGAALSDEGWLRTGDVGEIDVDGFLKITDRKKDLIITAGGKNVAPQNLENALKASRFVSQALVVGDRRPYISALVTLEEAEVATAGRDPRELVQEHVDGVNRGRSRVEQIKRFAILPRDFTQEDGELTPTLKLRRRVIIERFSAEIEALYR